MVGKLLYYCLSFSIESYPKVRASEQESSVLELLPRQRGMSVGCDEGRFIFPEELRLVAH